MPPLETNKTPSLWPLAILGILVSWLSHQRKAVHPQSNTYDKTSHTPIVSAIIPDVAPSPPRQKKTTCRPDQTPWWKTAFEVMAVLAGLGLLYWNIRQTQATEIAASAAISAAKTAASQLELSDRPWVTVDVFITSPLTYGTNGVQLNFSFVPKNIGHSPAQNVLIIPRLVPVSMGDDIRGIQKEICDSAPETNIAFPKYVLFPDEPFSEPFGLDMSTEALTAHWGKRPPGKGLPDPIPIGIVGCADYTYETSSKRHQTGFAFDILMKDGRLPLRSLAPLSPNLLILRQHGSFGSHFAN